jgi:rubrerythrin
MTKHWSVDDIAWDRFQPAKVDPDLLKVAKAAALVEYNANDYTAYLCSVFHDDPEFQEATRAWALEEVQHGEVLGRWAELADPTWDFQGSFKIFTGKHKIDTSADTSIRGSRSGELIARCMVETGTSSYYAALADACEEPVLKEICLKISADELRHYKLFYSYLKTWLARENLGKFRRLRIALSRIAETEDDELACAYWAAHAPDEPFDGRRFSSQYLSRAYGFYRVQHMDRAVGMIFKACGLSPQTYMFRATQKVAWWMTKHRHAKLEKLAREAA